MTALEDWQDCRVEEAKQTVGSALEAGSLTGGDDGVVDCGVAVVVVVEEAEEETAKMRE